MAYTDIPGTPQTPARVASNAMRRHGEELINFLQNWIEEGINLFWHNTDATPEEIATEQGADLVAAFNGHAGAVQLLAVAWQVNGNSGAPPIVWPPFAFTQNQSTGELIIDRNTPFVSPF